MEPEYVPSEFPDPQRPDVVYFKASLRPSCYQLADATADTGAFCSVFPYELVRFWSP